MPAAHAPVRSELEGFDPIEADSKEDLLQFISHCSTTWSEAGTQTPVPGETHSPREQYENERQTDIFIEDVGDQVLNFPDSEREREPWRARLKGRLEVYARECFGFSDAHIHILLSDDYCRVTKSFAQQARSFDRNIGEEELSQALRNVWVANCIQLFLDQGISLTPSIFAYSMLYPYTDNHLDSLSVTRRTKQETSRRLGLRLAGDPLPPVDDYERAVFQLVGLIEGQYRRAEFPQVYRGLLAIHRGQTKSLLLHGDSEAISPRDILSISFEKGGASVLADGYLAGGTLSREEAEFFFGFGVLLQLFDDLQDVDRDLESRQWSLFSMAARTEPLDRTTSRLCWFMESFLQSSERFAAPRFDVLKDLIRRNCYTLMFQTISQNQELFSTDYLGRLEVYSPLRFSFLRERRETVKKKYEQVRRALITRKKLHTLYEVLA